MRPSFPARRQLLLDPCTETYLTELQQQYRRAERAKQEYTSKTQGLIQRRIQEIQRLQDEREGFLHNLRVCHSADFSDVQYPTAMLTCVGRVVEELEAEKDKVASLNDQISEWERKLVGQRTGGGTTHCSMKSENKLLKIKNNLHRGIECFNTLMSRNGELREELKTLQLEEKQFLHVQSLLEKELHAVCKDTGNLMTKCTEAFVASVEMKETQRMLRDQNAKDAQYLEQRRNLQPESNSYLKAFLHTKANARSHDVDHRRVEKCTQSGSKELELKDFENLMTHILNEAGEIDLDELISNFIQMEEQSYTLLNFVNYQRNEAEAARRQNSQLCSERETRMAEELKQQEQDRALQRTVAIKREATEQQLSAYEQRVQFKEKLLDQLKEGVKSLLQASYDSCDQSCSSDRIQDENIKDSLTMVEDRVNELLTLLSYVHFQEKLSKWDSLTTLAQQLLGSTAPAVRLNTAAATPAPKCAD
ncbi:coiled-coil domain-containing protein 114-like [Sparus aurata]|uniref:Coiled-coil domain-containing protein 114-like n=1 Tax=Sparus aurata TaxID=8175 RepID=A0A671TH97_SPAAU|nr:coiled-coil domain-containing protein 114-like [Sparus aurata]XP_030278036.1 coiled-coil domain-containing protein 114-like [Sparus aurata]